jgi:hypothetical protein
MCVGERDSDREREREREEGRKFRKQKNKIPNQNVDTRHIVHMTCNACHVNNWDCNAETFYSKRP